jgi:hypothetical protein
MIPTHLRRAYERGRLRDAAIESLIVTVLVGIAICLGRVAWGQLALAVALVGTFLLARWRGLSWAQGALVGAAAGVIAMVAPAVLLAHAPVCVSPSCASWCQTFCAAGGAIAGVLVGLRARDGRALLVAAPMAVFATAIGCWPMGVAVVLGTAAAACGATCCGRLVRRVAP